MDNPYKIRKYKLDPLDNPNLGKSISFLIIHKKINDEQKLRKAKVSYCTIHVQVLDAFIMPEDTLLQKRLETKKKMIIETRGTNKDKNKKKNKNKKKDNKSTIGQKKYKYQLSKFKFLRTTKCKPIEVEVDYNKLFIERERILLKSSLAEYFNLIKAHYNRAFKKPAEICVGGKHIEPVNPLRELFYETDNFYGKNFDYSLNILQQKIEFKIEKELELLEKKKKMFEEKKREISNLNKSSKENKKQIQVLKYVCRHIGFKVYMKAISPEELDTYLKFYLIILNINNSLKDVVVPPNVICLFEEWIKQNLKEQIAFSVLIDTFLSSYGRVVASNSQDKNNNFLRFCIVKESFGSITYHDLYPENDLMKDCCSFITTKHDELIICNSLFYMPFMNQEMYGFFDERLKKLKKNPPEYIQYKSRQQKLKRFFTKIMEEENKNTKWRRGTYEELTELEKKSGDGGI